MRLLLLLILLLARLILFAQDKDESEDNISQKLESQVEKDDAETEDDTILQLQEEYRKKPLNINEASEDDLKLTGILNDLQVVNFLRYRKALGPLISIYELQAIPSWDIATIKAILPFITVRNAEPLATSIRKRLTGGEQSIMLRYGRVLETSKGYKLDSGSSNYYAGGPAKLYFRYKYNYQNVLQFGVLGEKDAGEQLFIGSRRSGFDFYSFHFFLNKLGRIKSLALGDYVINLGQGLIQWQGLAFRKSSSVTAIKRQGTVLRPYNSAGEFNFHRGAAVTLAQNKFNLTLFTSFRQFDANIVYDSISGKEFVSSLQTSGYHRTAAEIADRKKLNALMAGGNFQYRAGSFHTGFNIVQYQFSRPFQKSEELYNKYALSGKRFGNYSVDYAYTFKNIHVFGEVAVDNKMSFAILNGMLASIDSKVDFAMLYRRISRKYQSLFSNAFTESTAPSNEEGLYAGMLLRAGANLQFDAYFDVYRFPWLKYRINAPGTGNDYMIQITYTPNKNTELYTRYRRESKSGNLPGLDEPLTPVGNVPRVQWRVHLNHILRRDLSFKSRVEMVWIHRPTGEREQGFVWLADVFCKPMRSLATSMRLQYFETGGFDSRIYAYENDVQYSYSVPSFFDKGIRGYLNVRKDINNFMKLKRKKAIDTRLWLRIARTFYFSKKLIGSGLDTIEGTSKTDIKFQVVVAL